MGAGGSAERRPRKRGSVYESRGKKSWKRVSLKMNEAYRLINPVLMASIRQEWDVLQNQEEELRRQLCRRLLDEEGVFRKQFTLAVGDGDEVESGIVEQVLEGHSKKIINTIKFSIINVEDRKLFCRIVGHIGSFHAKFNNYMTHYRAVGVEFLAVIKDILGEDFTERSYENWRTLLEVIFKAMNEATKLAVHNKEANYDDMLADY